MPLAMSMTDEYQRHGDDVYDVTITVQRHANCTVPMPTKRKAPHKLDMPKRKSLMTIDSVWNKIRHLFQKTKYTEAVQSLSAVCKSPRTSLKVPRMYSSKNPRYQKRDKSYPEELNPFEESWYPEELNPFTQYQGLRNQFDEYPENLNPFRNSIDDYPEHLNPFRC